MSAEDKQHGRYATVSSLEIEAGVPRLIWLEGVPFAPLLVRDVFTNEDGSEGIAYLVARDTPLTSEQLTAIYPRRGKWKSVPSL